MLIYVKIYLDKYVLKLVPKCSNKEYLFSDCLSNKNSWRYSKEDISSKQVFFNIGFAKKYDIAVTLEMTCMM
jgi:hypothetical protein